MKQYKDVHFHFVSGGNDGETEIDCQLAMEIGTRIERLKNHITILRHCDFGH